MINISKDSPAGKAVAEVPYIPSISTRVLSLHPPVIFECAVSFIFYLLEKNKQNQTVWVSLKPLSDLLVLFNTQENPSWDGFVSMISKEFNKDYNYMGKMIADGTSNNPTTMTLTAHILKNKKFPKSAPLNIFDNFLLTQWLNEINFSQQSKGGVMIRMDNPCNEVVQACKEDLLARTMKHINARHKGPPTTSKRPRRSGAHSPANSDEVSFFGGFTISKHH